MYLNRNVHSNATLSHSRFRYVIVNYLYFSFQWSRIHSGIVLVGFPGFESGFLIHLLITAIGKKSPLIILFCLLLHYVPMLHPPLRVSGKPIITKLAGENFKIWYIFEVQWFTSLVQCISVTDFFHIYLFESPTSYINFRVILNLFHISKIILKLHLHGKLQVTLVHYLCYKKEVSYCQTLWLVKS